jgi:hypothetical protein
MSVYDLKHATPKMKYQHMNYVLDWRAGLQEQQDTFVPEVCPLCQGEMTYRPLWMVGEFEMCFPCYETLERQGKRLLAKSKAAVPQRFWLGKCANGSFIRYQAEKPLKTRGARVFTGAIGPFLSPLGAAYYVHQMAGSLKGLTPEQAERLARDDDDILWNMRRENLLAEMTMSDQERDDYERDMTAEYEND